MGKTALKDTGERMIPGFHKGTVMYAEHMTRYMAAQELARGKVVLDIASGSGYGTQLLAKEAKHVYGVDVDKDSIKYAQEHFPADNVTYKLGDGESIPLEDNTVDMLVTLETIEHIPDYKKFIREVKRVLKKDGIAIVSTPNKSEFTEGNHFHLHEFEYEELLSLLQKEFKYVDSYFQATWVNVAITDEASIKKEGLIKDIDTFNMKPLERDKYLYFYLVCSNEKITQKVPSLNAFGGHYSARELTDIQKLNDKNIDDYKTVLANAEKATEKLRQEYGIVVNELKQQNAALGAELGRMNAELEGIRASISYKMVSKVVKSIKTPKK